LREDIALGGFNSLVRFIKACFVISLILKYSIGPEIFLVYYEKPLESIKDSFLAFSF